VDVARGAAIVAVPMSSPVARSVASIPLRRLGEPLRVAFVGPRVWLDGCAPSEATHGMRSARFGVSGSADAERELAAVADFGPHVTVIFDPASLPATALTRLPGVSLGVLVAATPDEGTLGLDALDRIVSFKPSSTGAQLGGGEVWRAIPPPVSDALYADVRPLHHAPRVISIGRSSTHREEMLMPAKHHHDLVQVIHGVSGAPLRELLEECDVGVFVDAESGGGFGQQVGVHLAAGHLLLAEQLTPAHGLERDIDYLHIDSPDGLVWVLDRLHRFPEMYQRVRHRGRLKAEQYRASRVFDRVVHDLLADVATFGSPPRLGTSPHSRA
jgi:hypothetical protein